MLPAALSREGKYKGIEASPSIADPFFGLRGSLPRLSLGKKTHLTAECMNRQGTNMVGKLQKTFIHYASSKTYRFPYCEW